MTLPAAIITLGAVGLGTQLYGQYRAGQAAEAQAESEAAFHEYNARIAEREAAEVQEAAGVEERQLRKGGRRLRAKQRSLYGKLGLTFEGSPLDKMEETAREIEIDALRIRRGGELGFQRYSAQATLDRLSGKSAILRGTASRRASRWKMAGTALSGTAELLYTKRKLGYWEGL